MEVVQKPLHLPFSYWVYLHMVEEVEAILGFPKGNRQPIVPQLKDSRTEDLHSTFRLSLEDIDRVSYGKTTNLSRVASDFMLDSQGEYHNVEA